MRPTSALNASVPASLLNMYEASAKFKTELSKNEPATQSVARLRAASNFPRVPRASSAASILGRSTTLSLSIMVFAMYRLFGAMGECTGLSLEDAMLKREKK